MSATPRKHRPLWERSLIGLAVFIAALAIPLYAFKVSGKADYTDFGVYQLAASRLKAGDFAQDLALPHLGVRARTEPIQKDAVGFQFELRQ